MANLELPINFKDKATLPPSVDGTGYPYRISANDLDRNFAYAALDAEDGWIEQTSAGEHAGRKLKLPAIPGTGTFVLGCVDGNIQWIETEAC